MARIVCTHPNASPSINGISFHRDAHGMISDEVDPAVAAKFATIPGFKIVPSAAEKHAEEMAASVVTIDGPTGTLQIAGDYSRADLEALKAHWTLGAIEKPAPLPVPPPAPPPAVPDPGAKFGAASPDDGKSGTKDNGKGKSA